jgi:excisionase family DNA binding protein
MGKVPSLPGLPLADAAAHMGVSVDTLRRRIRRGELEAVKDDRGRYRMEVADTWPLPDGGGGHAAAVSLDYFAEVALLGHAAGVSFDTSADYSAEVAVLRERVARLEDELEAAEVAQREMRALVAQAQSVQLRLMGGEVVILSDEMRALVSQAQSLQLPLMGGGSPGSLDGGDATMPATPPPRRRWWATRILELRRRHPEDVDYLPRPEPMR